MASSEAVWVGHGGGRRREGLQAEANQHKAKKNDQSANMNKNGQLQMRCQHTRQRYVERGAPNPSPPPLLRGLNHGGSKGDAKAEPHSGCFARFPSTSWILSPSLSHLICPPCTLLNEYPSGGAGKLTDLGYACQASVAYFVNQWPRSYWSAKIHDKKVPTLPGTQPDLAYLYSSTILVTPFPTITEYQHSTETSSLSILLAVLTEGPALLDDPNRSIELLNLLDL